MTLLQVAATLQYAHANDVTPFMEPVLELCLAVLTRERREAVAVISLTPASARRLRLDPGAVCLYSPSVRPAKKRMQFALYAFRHRLLHGEF